MEARGKAKRWRRVVVLAICALVAAVSFWPHRHVSHHIARRTSPSFDARPKSDALVDAAGVGDLGRMKELLDAGVSSNADSSGDEGVCALSAAAGGGHLSAAKYLLDRGADVNADDFWGGNALVGASVEGEVDIVKLLLAHGADPNMEDDGASAIGYASHQLIVHENAAPRSNYRTIVDLLEANGAQTAGISRPWVWLAHMIPTF